MGGFLSGRYRTRNRGTVDATLRIDIRQLRALGFLKEGAVLQGSLSWTRGGEPSGSVGCTAHLGDPDNRYIEIAYTLNGERQVEREIRLEATPMRFGGLRYYARCPPCDRRCEVLPIIGDRIACRKCQRLAYASQSEDRLGRLRDKAKRLERQLFGKRRPRGANRRRLVEEWAAAEEAFELAFGRMAGALWAKIERIQRKAASFPAR